jgi:hypothetical protein
MTWQLIGTAYILESSEPLDWSAGGPHYVALRKPDGGLSGPYLATLVDESHLSIENLDFLPETDWVIEPAHLMFGPAETWTYPVLITSVSPRGSNGTSVEAVGYDARVYLSDDATAP